MFRGVNICGVSTKVIDNPGSMVVLNDTNCKYTAGQMCCMYEGEINTEKLWLKQLVKEPHSHLWHLL